MFESYSSQVDIVYYIVIKCLIVKKKKKEKKRVHNPIINIFIQFWCQTYKKSFPNHSK